jgi:hypothetical protein
MSTVQDTADARPADVPCNGPTLFVVKGWYMPSAIFIVSDSYCVAVSLLQHPQPPT